MLVTAADAACLKDRLRTVFPIEDFGYVYTDLGSCNFALLTMSILHSQNVYFCLLSKGIRAQLVGRALLCKALPFAARCMPANNYRVFAWQL